MGAQLGRSSNLAEALVCFVASVFMDDGRDDAPFASRGVFLAHYERAVYISLFVSLHSAVPFLDVASPNYISSGQYQTKSYLLIDLTGGSK